MIHEKTGPERQSNCPKPLSQGGDGQGLTPTSVGSSAQFNAPNTTAPPCCLPITRFAHNVFTTVSPKRRCYPLYRRRVVATSCGSQRVAEPFWLQGLLSSSHTNPQQVSWDVWWGGGCTTASPGPAPVQQERTGQSVGGPAPTTTHTCSPQPPVTMAAVPLLIQQAGKPRL